MAEAARALEPQAPVVEFFFSPGSRYCYLAASQLSSLERDSRCRVDWRPVDGNEIRSLRGPDPFDGNSVSGQYDWAYRRYDAECWADYYGIPFHEPKTDGLDFRLLARAAMAARLLEIPAAHYAWPLCRAVYGERRWFLGREVCLAIADENGLPRAEFEAHLDDPGTETALSESAAEARRRGAFGVPSFFVGDQLFWAMITCPWCGTRWPGSAEPLFWPPSIPGRKPWRTSSSTPCRTSARSSRPIASSWRTSRSLSCRARRSACWVPTVRARARC